jgi:holin-like protein
MVPAFAILLLCQLVGEGIVHVSRIPVPGPVIGLVVLAVGLGWWTRRGGAKASLGETPLGRAANGLLGHLSLLFVPAAVGIVQQGGVLAANGVAILVALAVSTVLALGVTAAVFVWAARRFVRDPAA